MSENLKQPKLIPCDDEEVETLIRDQVFEHHGSLEDATIRVLWRLRAPLQNWGSMKVADETLYWLSKGCDLVLVINQSLWRKLRTKGAKKGLIDHLLSTVRAKEGKTTHMEIEGEDPRQLYTASSPSLSVHPEVAARNPRFVDEIDELKRLHDALRDPKQFLMDFAAEQEEAEETEEADEEEAA